MASFGHFLRTVRPRHTPSHKRTPKLLPYPFLPLKRHNVTVGTNWQEPCPCPIGNQSMDVQRKGVKKRKTIVTAIVMTLALVGLAGAWRWARNLKPAAPGVELSTLWPDTVKRGPMVREVRGLGTLVPEDTVLLTATTESTVKKILVKPGVPVKADTVIMVMTSPELETDLSASLFAMRGAQADYENLKVTLERSLLDLQSAVAQTSADYNTAKLESDRDT